MSVRRLAIPPIEREILASLDNGALRLILMPTEACNFRCVYCYEEFKYKRMQAGVVLGVKRWLEARCPELTELTLSWFGGEPLLALDVMEDILRHAQGLVRKRPQMRFRCDITTNAYRLTQDVFRRLLELDVREYQVALDGPREWHDRKRILANGGPTFDRIWGNLLAMREVEDDFRVVLRLHADGQNHRALPGFIDECGRAFGGDRRFRLFVRPLSRLGGPNDATLDILDGEKSEAVLAGLARRSKGLRVERMKDVATSSLCYAAQANSYLVRANGRLNKCTVALEHPANQVGRLRPDGRVELNNARVGRWMRGLLSRDPREMACPMIGLADSAPEGVDRRVAG